MLDLLPVFLSLMQWGDKYLQEGRPPLSLVDAETGHAVGVRVTTDRTPETRADDNGHVRSKPVAVTLLLAEPAAVVSDTEAEAAAKLFKALSDPVRIRLVSLIRHSPGGEACFCDLAEDFDMPQPSLSHHLRVLVTAGILSRERRGTWSWYSLVPQPLETLGNLLRDGGPLADRPAPVSNGERDRRC